MSHGGDCARRHSRRALRLALGLTLGVLAVEVAGGVLSGSLALLSDAGHMLADAGALALSLFALALATRPATPEKTYGYLRVEILSALGNGILLGLVALLVWREAWARLWAPRPVDAPLLIVVAVIGLLANLVNLFLLQGHARSSLNLRGAYLHVLGDALSSVGVIAAGVGMAVFDEPRLDPAVGALIGGLILWSAQRLVRDAVDVLLEAAPKGVVARDVSQAILAQPGVVAVHDLHVWSLTTGVGALSAHVLVHPESLPQTDRILEQVNAVLRARFAIAHTTLQVESDAAEHACAVGD